MYVYCVIKMWISTCMYSVYTQLLAEGLCTKHDLQLANFTSADTTLTNFDNGQMLHCLMCFLCHLSHYQIFIPYSVHILYSCFLKYAAQYAMPTYFVEIFFRTLLGLRNSQNLRPTKYKRYMVYNHMYTLCVYHISSMGIGDTMTTNLE